MQTSMVPRQQENTAIMEETFSTRSAPRSYKQDQLAVEIRTAGVQSLFAVAVRSLAEAGERASLEAATKQQQLRRVCVIVNCKL
jgi:hypothetical protein